MRIFAAVILALGIAGGYFVWSTQAPDGRFSFKYGLDIKGGTHLVYKADVSKIEPSETKGSMETLRDVIEKRVNLFGVSEPLVQTEKGGFLSGDSGEQRLIVELPGVTDVKKAVELIGETPVLEFRLLLPEHSGKTAEEIAALGNGAFVSTGLNGRLLEKARLEFLGNGGISQPVVSLEFNKEGKELLAKVTREHAGEVLAIFLDGSVIETPFIREEISDGRAQISGGFSAEEAKELARRLSLGALPVPIELVSTESVGASLGGEVLSAGVKSGLLGLALVSLFMVFWYRLPGLVSVVALSIYIILMLLLFKLIPVVLSAAGLAGFILSIGMAVDANVIIFERIKEEMALPENNLESSVRLGFSRAWLSIRDGNLSSIITAVILFWFGTSLVEGFALTFGIGVLISMLTAISVSRTLLLAIGGGNKSGTMGFLYGNGFK